MARRNRTTVILTVAGVLVLGIGVYAGVGFASKVLTWRHLDAAYQEQFLPPSEIAPDLEGKRLVFHVKTGLDQGDSQTCVGFNIIFAALEGGRRRHYSLRRWCDP